MVVGEQILDKANAMLFAAKNVPDSVLEQLNGAQRAAVIMALLGLTLVGLFLITFVMVGGHWVRKLARHRPIRREFTKNDMADGRLQEALQNILPETKSNDTVLLDSSSKDTKAES